MTILITGGISGLGRAITADLASDDAARLIVTYHRSAEEAERIRAAHPNVRPVKCDFGSEAEIGQLQAIIGQENIDVLINNAFTGFRKEHFFKTEAAYFLQSFTANVLSTVRITQKAISVFRKKNF